MNLIKNMKYAVLTGALAMSAAYSHAAFFDAKDIKELRFGMNPYAGVYTTADEDGEVPPVMDIEFFSGIGVMPYKKRGQRLWFEASYQYYEITATEKIVGQELNRYKFLGSLQREFRLGSKRTFWAGAGGGLVFEQAAGRHTIDTDGYLDKHYESKQTADILLVGNAQMPMFRFNMGLPVEFGLSAQLEAPITTLNPAIAIGATFLFK